jgi:predicted  nucleic acid-binding Zn-ribbon protein
MNHPDDNLFD